MGQFIALPDGTMLVVNGGSNGTAGYAQSTFVTPNLSMMPFWESLASGPVGQPAIYNPNAPSGQRWSQAGLATSKIARLYHSSALLMPDGSVLIAGSNPNLDVNTTAIYPTTYQAERFYPPYFNAPVRPTATGQPNNLTYGGSPFDLTVPASAYSGTANAAAANSTVMLMRPGWTTHGMNMGQRAMQLNNTYTVNSDGSFVLHVSQPPANPNLLTPGPVLMFVVVNGIPSNATMAIVGNGQVGTQPTLDLVALPASQTAAANVTGTANGSSPGAKGNGNGSDGSNSGSTSSGSSHTGVIIGGIIAAIAVVGIIGAGVGIFIARRRRSSQQARARNLGSGKGGPGMGAMGVGVGMRPMRDSSGSAFVPLQNANDSMAWNASSTSLNTAVGDGGVHTPYKDDYGYPPRGGTPATEYDPYYEQSQNMANARR